jgi:hypothetical protein
MQVTSIFDTLKQNIGRYRTAMASGQVSDDAKANIQKALTEAEAAIASKDAAKAGSANTALSQIPLQSGSNANVIAQDEEDEGGFSSVTTQEGAGKQDLFTVDMDNPFGGAKDVVNAYVPGEEPAAEEPIPDAEEPAEPGGVVPEAEDPIEETEETAEEEAAEESGAAEPGGIVPEPEDPANPEPEPVPPVEEPEPEPVTAEEEAEEEPEPEPPTIEQPEPEPPQEELVPEPTVEEPEVAEPPQTGEEEGGSLFSLAPEKVIPPELIQQFNEAKPQLDGKLYKNSYASSDGKGSFLCADLVDIKTNSSGYVIASIEGIGAALASTKLAYVTDENTGKMAIAGKMAITYSKPVMLPSSARDDRYYPGSKVHIASLEEIDNNQSNWKTAGVKVKDWNPQHWKDYKSCMENTVNLATSYKSLNSIGSDSRLKKDIEDVNVILYDRFMRG